MLSKNAKVIVVLPCEGSPYIWKNKIFNTKTSAGKSELFEQSQKVVRGSVERCDRTTLLIHPMFENRWSIAQELLRHPDAEVYMNENGIYECSPNMATVRLEVDYSKAKGALTHKEFLALPKRPSRVPFFGDIALVVPYTLLQSVIDPDAMRPVRISDYYAEMGIVRPAPESDEFGYHYEENDEGDNDKFKALVKSKGWFIGSFGQVYMKPTGRPDEKESADYDSDSDSDA
jgi:hypothetical protein